MRRHGSRSDVPETAPERRLRARLHHGLLSHQVIALAATGQFGMAAAGQIRLAVVTPLALSELKLEITAAMRADSITSLVTLHKENDRLRAVLLGLSRRLVPAGRSRQCEHHRLIGDHSRSA